MYFIIIIILKTFIDQTFWKIPTFMNFLAVFSILARALFHGKWEISKSAMFD